MPKPPTFASVRQKPKAPNLGKIADEDDEKPEWLKVSTAIRKFGIGKTSLYELISEGKVKSVCLRKRGAERGTRLISYDSLASLLESGSRSGTVTI